MRKAVFTCCFTAHRVHAGLCEKLLKYFRVFFVVGEGLLCAGERRYEGRKRGADDYWCSIGAFVRAP